MKTKPTPHQARTNRPRKRPDIPAGASRKDMEAREKLITDSLRKLRGSSRKGSVFNEESRKLVKITHRSIKETARHASKRKASTLSALDAERQIRTSKKKRTSPPKNNSTQQAMRIEKMHEYRGKREGKKVKVMIGEQHCGDRVLYSITTLPGPKGKKKKKKNRWT